MSRSGNCGSLTPISPENTVSSASAFRPGRFSIPSGWYAEKVEKDATRTMTGTSEALPLEELAACQGVGPVTDFDALLGHPPAEDESADEFAAMLRE
jgi:hypothetical protein